MIKKGIVKNVQSNGTWDGSPHGIMYKYEVTIGDDTGTYMSTKNTCRFEVGQETDYEYIDGKYPKIKVGPNPQYQNNITPSISDNKTQEYIVKQNALTNACNIVGEDDVVKIIEIAEVFKNWVLNDVKPKNDSNAQDLPY